MKLVMMCKYIVILLPDVGTDIGAAGAAEVNAAGAEINWGGQIEFPILIYHLVSFAVIRVAWCLISFCSSV